MDNSTKIAFLVLVLVTGLVGWAVIELMIWLFSFVHISFGGKTNA